MSQADEFSTLKDDVAIDMASLEYEWTRQSSLYMKWSLRLGQSIDEKDRLDARLDRLKRSLERKKGELSLLVKRDPTRLKLPPGVKPTVDLIGAWVNTNTEVMRIQDEMDEVEDLLSTAKRNISVFTSAQIALIHKKKSLEMLTEMIMSGYYSDPSIPKEARDKVKERSAAVHRAEHSDVIAQSAARRKQSKDEVDGPVIEET